MGGAGWTYLSDYPFADQRTGTGERKRFNTPDGTQIDLAARSRLSIDFTDSSRRITLHQGEAFFNVAKDGRPFSVEAGEGVTTALGTSFGVRLRGPEARVIVVEHTIRVSLRYSAVNVDAGYEVEYGATLGPVQQGDANEELSWREGRLVFNGTPLSEVVQALNLWRRGRIVVLDRDLAQRPVTFIADVNRLDTIDKEIERSMRVRTVQLTPFLILLLPSK
jgi:transmembrane sensor